MSTTPPSHHPTTPPSLTHSPSTPTIVGTPSPPSLSPTKTQQPSPHPQQRRHAPTPFVPHTQKTPHAVTMPPLPTGAPLAHPQGKPRPHAIAIKDPKDSLSQANGSQPPRRASSSTTFSHPSTARQLSQSPIRASQPPPASHPAAAAPRTPERKRQREPTPTIMTQQPTPVSSVRRAGGLSYAGVVGGVVGEGEGDEPETTTRNAGLEAGAESGDERDEPLHGWPSSAVAAADVPLESRRASVALAMVLGVGPDPKDEDGASPRGKDAHGVGRRSFSRAGSEVGDEEKKTLWFGDLEPHMDENYLRMVCRLMEWEVDGIKLIKPSSSSLSPSPVAGQPSPLAFNAGFCFITFPSHKKALEVLTTLTPSPTNAPVLMPNSSHHFKANWATGGNTGIPGTPFHASPSPGASEYSVFIGDLSPLVKEEDLVKAFTDPPEGYNVEGFLSVVGAKIMRDPISGVSKLFGFVRFSTEADQQRALVEMQGVPCLSRPMRISSASIKQRTVSNGGSSMSGMNISRSTTPDSFYPGGPIADSAPAAYPANHFETAPPRMRSHTSPATTNGSRLTVPESSMLGALQLSQSLTPFVPPVGYGSDFSSSHGVVLTAQDLALAAFVGEHHAGQPQAQVLQAQAHAIVSNLGIHSTAANPFAQCLAHIQYLAALPSLSNPNGPPVHHMVSFNDPQNSTVFVGGLSSLITEETLRMFFSPFGEIGYVKVPPGKSCGFVHFHQKCDADKAIERMQGFPMAGGKIRLSWGKPQAHQRRAVGDKTTIPTSPPNPPPGSSNSQLALALQSLASLNTGNPQLLQLQIAAATSSNPALAQTLAGLTSLSGIGGIASLGGLNGTSGLSSPALGLGGLGNGLGGIGSNGLDGLGGGTNPQVLALLGLGGLSSSVGLGGGFGSPLLGGLGQFGLGGGLGSFGGDFGSLGGLTAADYAALERLQALQSGLGFSESPTEPPSMASSFMGGQMDTEGASTMNGASGAFQPFSPLQQLGSDAVNHTDSYPSRFQDGLADPPLSAAALSSAFPSTLDWNNLRGGLPGLHSTSRDPSPGLGDSHSRSKARRTSAGPAAYGGTLSRGLFEDQRQEDINNAFLGDNNSSGLPSSGSYLHRPSLPGRFASQEQLDLNTLLGNGKDLRPRASSDGQTLQNAFKDMNLQSPSSLLNGGPFSAALPGGRTSSYAFAESVGKPVDFNRESPLSASRYRVAK